MKTAIYCRVSTEDQERDGTSLKTQLEACRDYCQGCHRVGFAEAEYQAVFWRDILN
jgi:DNA invertase Pin-like site-specific DNA recombinase